MEIRLSRPDEFIDKKVEAAALQAGCWSRIRWWMPEGCRFILVDPKTDKPATYEQHDRVIASLFMHDPHAMVRTAIATYKGAAQFEQQRKGRVA
jgi:hypothetical protein